MTGVVLVVACAVSAALGAVAGIAIERHLGDQWRAGWHAGRAAALAETTGHPSGRHLRSVE